MISQFIPRFIDIGRREEHVPGNGSAASEQPHHRLINQ
jgi:hypothetical protein